MDESRRNDVFDRELKRALAAGGGAAPGAHVDAELAAAWMDRRLGAAEARSVEAHLADCVDCQTLMATLARLAPDAEMAGTAPAWWRRLRAGWVVPATVAAAAALVIWVVVPQQQRQTGATPPAPAQVSERAQTPEPAAAERSPAREPDAAEPARAAAPPAANAPEADVADARQFAPVAPAAESQRKAESEPASAPPPTPAPPPSPQAPAPAPPASPAASPNLERRERRADAPAPARPSTLNDSVALESKQSAADAQSPKAAAAGEPAVRQEAAAPAPGAAVAGGAARESFSQAAGLRASSALTIVAADGGARWRRTGTAIEFARRANADFTAVTLPAPASAITAGASPGGTVCWLVGNAGTVLVTTDGVRFTRVASPMAIDLAAVTAADARTAVVTTTDGRRFRTADRGATWAPLP